MAAKKTYYLDCVEKTVPKMPELEPDDFIVLAILWGRSADGSKHPSLALPKREFGARPKDFYNSLNRLGKQGYIEARFLTDHEYKRSSPSTCYLTCMAVQTMREKMRDCSRICNGCHVCKRAELPLEAAPSERKTKRRVKRIR